MQRVKNIDYDDDDLYSDEDYTGDEPAEEYSAEDKDNFATLTPVVRAELEEGGVPEANVSQKDIEDALWHYFWDVGKSVAYLKNAKGGSKKASGTGTPAKEKAKSKFDLAAEKSSKAGDNTPKKASKPASGLEKRTEALKINNSSTPPTPPPQTKVKSRGLDVPKLWSEGEADRKKSAAFVVIGHVDHGKSTLMGRLLLDTGAVAQRDIDRYKKQAAEMGKASFALAWVMDTGSEERERGVTVDIAQHHFSADNIDFTILDAPGHRDFVPNMIGGASMADLAILVVDANQLESGLKGQTREHILLAKAVGLKRVIVAVNKLDASTPAWKQSLFEDVSAVMRKFLSQAGFADDEVSIIPCSGLSGANVAKPTTESEAKWVTQSHPTLLAELEAHLPPSQPLDVIRKPLRMQIADVFRGGITNPLSISGRISTGSIQIGDAILVQPAGETASIKAIDVGGDGRDYTVAGELCTLHLTEIEPQHLRAGDSIGPVQTNSTGSGVVQAFTARVRVLDGQTLLPQGVDVHFGRLHVPGSVAQLIATLDEQGDMTRRKPRIVKSGQRASVKIVLEGEQGMPIDEGARVVLRSGGGTVAAGIVESVG